MDCRTTDLIEDRGYAGGRVPGDGAASDASLADRCPLVGSSSAATAAHVPRADPRLALGAGTYGFSVSIYLSNWLALNLEYRVMPFLWNHTGTDERGMELLGEVLTFCPSDASSGDSDHCASTGELPDHRIDPADRRWAVNHMLTLGATFHFPFTPRLSP